MRIPLKSPRERRWTSPVTTISEPAATAHSRILSSSASDVTTLNRSTGVTCLANPSTWLRYSSTSSVGTLNLSRRTRPTSFVHGVDGDLNRLVVGLGVRHLPAIGASARHERLPPGFAETKPQSLIRRFIQRHTFSLG